MSELFRLEDVHKSYFQSGKEIKILEGLHLSIEAGESVAITGASGVGKSTLLHIMGSLERPTKGRVLFEEIDLYGLGEAELERIRNSKIGFVFQFHYLLPEFTSLENVMMPLLISGKALDPAREEALAALNMVGLASKAYNRPGELSGGEQQRVAIARAIVQGPKVVLADEPTGNLDWHTGDEIGKLLVALNRERGTTVVVVTHNIKLASLMARHMELEDGKIREY
ncbi:MAG: ABC transporter ATP-binding protein [Desulfatiglandales bacterium]